MFYCYFSLLLTNSFYTDELVSAHLFNSGYKIIIDHMYACKKLYNSKNQFGTEISKSSILN